MIYSQRSKLQLWICPCGRVDLLQWVRATPLLFGERFADFWLDRIANSIPVVTLLGEAAALVWGGRGLP